MFDICLFLDDICESCLRGQIVVPCSASCHGPSSDVFYVDDDEYFILHGVDYGWYSNVDGLIPTLSQI